MIGFRIKTFWKLLKNWRDFPKKPKTIFIIWINPNIYFRISFILLVIVSVAAIIYTLSLVSVNKQDLNLQNIISTSEPFLNEAVMIGAAFNLISKLENILKQKKILAALHQLSTIIHVIDMHQLTKDPTSILEKTPNIHLKETLLNTN